MDKYIEVTGESEYEEYPDKMILDIDVYIRAAKVQTAKEDIKNVVNKLLDQLFKNGLKEDEVFFGGRDTYIPWWKKSKAGAETRNRITIKSSRQSLVYAALENIDQYKSDKRISV